MHATVETTVAIRQAPALSTSPIAGPRWAWPLAVYQVNPGRYPYPNGEFLRRFDDHLPVLHDMGVGMLWLMPIFPRGGWGSAYCICDFYDVDTAWGTRDDLDRLVAHAHQLGMRVILDWVPNHTSFDHPFIHQRPELYKRHPDGTISTVGPWKDIAQLDWSNRDVWTYQRDAMIHWMKRHHIDGFRMDVAGRVPLEFWNWLRPQLDAAGSVFMLAEDDNPAHHPAFDMSYDWQLPLALWDIAAGAAPATAIDDVLAREAAAFPNGALRMRFLSNHDWHETPNPGNYHDLYGNRLQKLDGNTVMLRYGRGVRAFATLCATLPGKPLLYNGQELGDGLHKPATPQQMRDNPTCAFYAALLRLYRDNPALHAGRFTKLPSDHDDHIYAFLREHDRRSVLVVLNLSDHPQTATVNTAIANHPHDGGWTEFPHQRPIHLGSSLTVTLAPWTSQILTR